MDLNYKTMLWDSIFNNSGIYKIPRFFFFSINVPIYEVRLKLMSSYRRLQPVNYICKYSDKISRQDGGKHAHSLFMYGKLRIFCLLEVNRKCSFSVSWNSWHLFLLRSKILNGTTLSIKTDKTRGKYVNGKGYYYYF